MKTAHLRCKVSFFEDKKQADEYGQPIDEVVKAFDAYAQIIPLNGNEKFIADKVQTEVTHKVRLRYDKRINSKMFFTYEGRKFEITSVVSPYERKKELVLMCKEVF